MVKIVDGDGLCSLLSMKKRTLQTVWREFPHFFIATGRDLRGARFDEDEVIAFLKTREHDHGRMVQKKQGLLDVQISKQQGNVRGKWLSDKKRSDKGRKGKKERVGFAEADPYNLLL